MNSLRKITLYRDDSTTQVVYENVKHYFWLANNTVLSIAVVSDIATGKHYYVQWPRERFCWFKDQPMDKTLALLTESEGECKIGHNLAK